MNVKCFACDAVIAVNDADDENDAAHFRGPRSLYDSRGLAPVTVRERDTVVRLSVVPVQ